MQTVNIESHIIDRVRSLSGNQKEEILSYLDALPKKASAHQYRRMAMKQIREALKTERSIF